MTKAFHHYGVKERNELASELDRHVEEVRINGFSVVPGLLGQTEVETLVTALDSVYQAQIEEIAGEDQLHRINDANVVRCPFVYDERFLRLATHPTILALVERFLGDYFILMLQNGVINRPDVRNYQSGWHRDLNYQHFVCSRPLSISILYCLDDFTEETGGTHVLPGSQKLEAFPSQQFVEAYQKPIVAAAGSAIVLDSMCYHRAGTNRSARPRRGVNHMYVLPFLKQQISLPSALGGRYADDRFLSRFLGYESDPSNSVLEWRKTRLGRLQT